MDGMGNVKHRQTIYIIEMLMSFQDIAEQGEKSKHHDYYHFIDPWTLFTSAVKVSEY